MGVEKAKSKVSKSRILIYLYDRADTTFEELKSEIKTFKRDDLQIYLVENKIDLLTNLKTDDLEDKLNHHFNKNEVNLMRISTLESKYIDKLKLELSKNINLSTESNVVVSNSRHLDALKKSISAIESVKKGLKDGLSGDLLSVDLNEAILNISIITGKIDIDQDILGSIFSKFCIGK
jgi:Predicted GTPase